MSQDQPPGSQQLGERIEARIAQARQEEAIEIYKDLLDTIWRRILPTLGRVSVMAITERALMLTAEQYPILKSVQIMPDGVSLQQVSTDGNEADSHALRSGLKEFITNQINILAMLTGDILVKHLLNEIEGKISK